MCRSRWDAAFGCAVSLCLVLLARPVFAVTLTKTCLTGTDPSAAGDAAQITAARALIDAACPCASFDGTPGKTHRAYVQCAAQTIAAQITAVPANLRRQCRGTVKKIYARSTCGNNPALHTVPCIKTAIKTGKHNCSIKPTTQKDGVTARNACADGTRSSAVACPQFTHCLDAADTDDDLRISESDSGSCPVVHDIEVSPNPAEFWLDGGGYLGTPIQFSAIPRDLNGRALPYPVSWSASDPTLAMVDASGLATGLSSGTVTIEASTSAITGTASLCVVATPTAQLLPPSGSYPAQSLLISAAGSTASCGRPQRYLWSCARLQGANPNLCSTVVFPQNVSNTPEFEFPLALGDTYSITVQVLDFADALPPDSALGGTTATITLTGTDPAT